MEPVTAVGHKCFCHQLGTDEPAPGQTVGMVPPGPVDSEGRSTIFIIIGLDLITLRLIGKLKVQNIVAIKTAVGEAVVGVHIQVDLDLVIVEIIGKFEAAIIIGQPQDCIKKLIKIGAPSGKHPGAFHTAEFR